MLDAHGDVCSNPPVDDAQNLVFFDATLDTSGDLVGCPSVPPVLGACGEAPLVLLTGPEGWVSAGVILGDTPMAIYSAQASVPFLDSLEFTYGAQVIAGPLDHCTPFRGRSFLVLGFDDADATRPGDQLARRPSLSVLNQAATTCDPVFTGGECVAILCPPNEPCTADPACLAVCSGATPSSPECEDWCVANPSGCVRHYALRCSDTYTWHESQIVEDSVSFSVTGGGTAQPPQPTGPGTVETELTAGPAPGGHEVSVELESHDRQWLVDAEGVVDFGVLVHPGTGEPLFPPISWSRDLGTFWGIEPAITAIAPDPIELERDDVSRTDVDVDYSIAPALYPPGWVRLDLFTNDVWRANFVNTSGATSGRITLPEGIAFDSQALHEVEVVVNPGTSNEVRSARQALPIADRLLIDYSRSVRVRQELDLANERVCGLPTLLRFEVSRAADVTVSFRRIEALELDGTQDLGPESFLIFQQRYEAGEHFEPVTPLDLLAGDYAFEVRAVDPLTGDEEVGQGLASSLRIERDSLPVGHVLIKGVNLWDGHLTLSRRDLSYAGRGVPLDFRRSYSSHSVEPGPLGIGWSHSYVSRLSRSPCGDVIISGGEGSGMRFVADGTGGFVPLRGYHGTLVFDPVSLSYDFYTPAGTRYHYRPILGASGWWLSRIEDPNGNTTALFYQTGASEPLLQQVVDAGGRSLSFTYETRIFALWAGQVITSVSGSGDLSVSFEYDSRGHLVRASREGGARIEEYGYELMPSSGREVYGILDEVTDALDGGVTRYGYEPALIGIGGTTTASRLAVVELLEPEGGTTLFGYDLDGLAARGESTTTTVTDRRGKITRYMFDRYGSPLEIIDPEDNVTTMTWSADDVLMTSVGATARAP